MKKHASAADRRSGLLSTSKRRQLGYPDQQAIVSGTDSLSDEQHAEPESVITQVQPQVLLYCSCRVRLSVTAHQGMVDFSLTRRFTPCYCCGCTLLLPLSMRASVNASVHASTQQRRFMLQF